MPTYEYRCQTCSYIFEEFQNITEKPISRCPKCDHKVQRLIGTGAGVIFKDSGSSAVNSNKDFSPSCGRDSPCCGRETPCDKKPCE